MKTITLLLVLLLASCTTAQLIGGATLAVGAVCRHAADITDHRGVVVGVSIVAAMLGQDCGTGGAVVTVPADRPAAVRAARALEPGDLVEVDGVRPPGAEGLGPPQITARTVRRVR